ncbi:MAG: ADP-ribosylglycohydrolase [uncultured Sulfurovum sp.]|uniref:ADP-ribosylglycohydrolase n=1 Tax=uncultured Sulfurovum sp. TaxID=269237 RepID=A0A6S6SSG0_9BACT|nr:MAG: ADP-ribosylglycohydrolase [uncultured Sulfurovum sp.]
MKKDKLKGLIWGSLLADAYSLGGHWLYDQRELESSMLNFSGLNDPLCPYHPTKKAGDLTHYGDQSQWLLEYMNDAEIYDPFAFGKIWQDKMTEYTGYKDGATTTSLANMNAGTSFLAAGSDSQDLSIVGRHAAIIFSIENVDDIIESVKFHTCLTHMSKDMIDASKYITEVTLAMIHNLDVVTTIKERAAFYGETVNTAVNAAFEAKDIPTNEAIRALGRTCDIKDALASTIYLLINYYDDFEALLKANVLAGGDSAARGMIAGMILGARYGFEAIKPSWIEELNEYEKLNHLID